MYAGYFTGCQYKVNHVERKKDTTERAKNEKKHKKEKERGKKRRKEREKENEERKRQKERDRKKERDRQTDRKKERRREKEKGRKEFLTYQLCPLPLIPSFACTCLDRGTRLHLTCG